MAYTTQEDINLNIKLAFEEGGIEAVREVANAKINSWKNEPVAIGITGASGVGKSSFINTYRGIKYDDEEGAAKVDVIQTTKEATPYPDPNHPNIVLYDLPGVGTPAFPQSTYLENPKVGLKNYDLIVIITATRFTEHDLWLYKEITEMKKPAFLVRTKVMIDVDNTKKSSRALRHKHIGDIIDELITKYKHEMNDGRLPDNARVYFIDNHEPENPRLDFSLLVSDIIEKVSFAKGEAILYSLNHCSSLLIMKRVEYLDKRRKYWAILSGTVALIPVPGTSMVVDFGIIKMETAFYKKQLGLEEYRVAGQTRALEIIKQMSSISMDLIRSIIVSEGMENVATIIPGIGFIIAAVISAGHTYFMLGKLLQKIEKDALMINKLLIEDLANNQL